jgi:hypothetical protein
MGCACRDVEGKFKPESKSVIARYEAISTQAGQLCMFALYSIEIASYLAMTRVFLFIVPLLERIWVGFIYRSIFVVIA